VVAVVDADVGVLDPQGQPDRRGGALDPL